jgi:nitroreductase
MYKLICGVFIMTMILGTATASEFTAQKLPQPVITGGKPLMEVIASRKTERTYSSKTIDSQTLSEILWSAWGISHEDKRTIPTSRNKQNLKVYAIKADGVWLYNAEKNTLEPVNNKDMRNLFATQDFVETAPLTLLYTGSDDKNSPMHAGSAYQNVGLYCTSRGLNNVVRGYFDYEQVHKELNLPEDENVIISQTIGWK